MTWSVTKPPATNIEYAGQATIALHKESFQLPVPSKSPGVMEN